MSPHAASTQTSRIISGRQDFVSIPADGGVGRRVVFVPQQSTVGVADTTAAPGSFTHVQAIAEEFVVIAGVSIDEFGNSTALANFDTAMTWVAANLPGVLTDKALFWAVSRGMWLGLRCAADRPTRVAGIAGIVPVGDINGLRLRNSFGLRATIDTAWGVTYPAALPAAADMLVRAQAGAFSGLAVKAWCSSADTVCPLSETDALIAAIGSTASRVISSTVLDHSDAAVGAASTSQVVDFLLAHGS